MTTADNLDQIECPFLSCCMKTPVLKKFADVKNKELKLGYFVI